MKKKMQQIFKRQLEWIIQMECWLSSQWVKRAHRRLLHIQWAVPPCPEHFDHQIDLFYQWPLTRNSLWLERGVYGSLALKTGGNNLELACGDGFNTRNFYSLRSKSIIACDFDREALKTAKRKNSAPNINYVLSDIRHDMPKGKFDNIFWDAAIEHFTPIEIKKLLHDIKSRLALGGILSGYTLVEKRDLGNSLPHHESEFKDKEDLASFFKPHFKHVTVFETIYPSRHNLYFWASDGTIPFSKNWPNGFSIDSDDKTYDK